MGQLFVNIYQYFFRKRFAFYAVLTIVLSLVIFGASRIKIEDDAMKMMPEFGKSSKILNTLKSTKLSEKIIVLIQTEDENNENLQAVGDEFNEILADSLKEFISSVKYRNDDEAVMEFYQLLQKKFPLFLSENDYKQIDTIISVQNIEATMIQNYKLLSSASGIVLKDRIFKDPLGISNLVTEKLNQLQFNKNIVVVDGAFFTSDMKNMLMLITPSFPSSDNKQSGGFIEKFNNLKKSVESKYRNIEIRYYGAAAVANSNASQLKKDILLTLSITVIGLIGFILFYFKRKRIPFILFTPVTFGGLFAISMIFLIKGSISNIVLGAGCIIIGIGINYSLHFINHFRHSQSIEETIKELLLPLSIGSVTTVASFFSLQFVNSPILNDFGMFAGWSLIGTSLFALIFLPHLLPQLPESDEPKFIVSSTKLTSNKWFAILIIALTVFFSFFINKVSFESDLNQLSYQNPELKKYETAINALQGDSIKTVNIVVQSENLNTALEKNKKLLEILNTQSGNRKIESYSSVASFLPDSASIIKQAIAWKKYWTEERKKSVATALKAESRKYGFKETAFENFYKLIDANDLTIDSDEYKIIKKSIAEEQIIITDSQTSVLSSIQVKQSKRKDVYAAIEEAGAIVLDKQIITDGLIGSIYSNFNKILLYTSLIVFTALYFSYGRIELALITFIPMALSWIWILGIMGLLDLKFNIVNIIISTFIFGLGDDFSIFITDGLSKKFKEGKDIIASHKEAIFLASVTTILGLGALIFAKHPALKSIAWLSILGLASVIIIGQTIQPLLFNFFIQKRKEKGLAPWTIPTLLLAFVAFTYFVIFGFLLSIAGFILLKVAHHSSLQKRKYIYHILLSKFVKSLVYMMANVRKVHINRDKADFSKPSVIICNHQSFLDILVVVMQHPKLILLTNEWVYYSPFFGKVVQLGDYYPAFEGAEGVDRIAKKVSEGYSVVVFPEGTRSQDGNIKRFKKGAFYIAEQLKLDIQPLVLHGTGDSMRKSDFMLYNGQMTMKYLPRIKYDDYSFGKEYSERAKNISKYFKEEYAKLKEEIEQPIYFRQRLLMNYVYKGPIIEWYTWKKIQIENYYKTYDTLLKNAVNITDLGCGYGYMAYMLSFMNSKRVIKGLDYDEEKIIIANNNFSKTNNINFFHKSITEHEFTMQDAFVINDVIHYLKYEEQETLIKNCADHLNENGLIILKDANVENTAGQKLTWFSEFISTNFGFNKMGHDQLFFTSQKRLQTIADKYNLTLTIAEAPKYSSNTIWTLGKK
jgi:uncharacterized protein